jgi:putative tryptophan/tyrosine transport system substrate-binding protein
LARKTWIRRREFILGLGAATALPRAARADDPAAGTWRIAILGSERSKRSVLEGLRELGYVEGQNLVVESRSLGARLDQAVAELVASKPDVIVTAGTQSVLAFKKATQDIPIVMASSDPVATGLIESLAHPGGNVTGFGILSPEISGKRLGLLREAAGDIRHVAILYNSADPPALLSLKETEEAAKKIGVRTSVVPVQAGDDFEPALTGLEKSDVQGLVILAAPLMDLNRERIAALALKLHWPSIYADPAYPRAGGLLSYGPNFLTIFHDQAAYVDKILKGSAPADLPVAQPTKFELVVNDKTAKALGIELSTLLLSSADEVIE